MDQSSLASSLSFETREDDTPRNSGDLFDRLVQWIPPASPSAGRKTKSRAAKFIPRTDSLKESKVLMVTGMRRTESIMEPELFHYHDHFEFLSLVGETKTSEVFRVRHKLTGEVFAVKRSRKRFRSKLQRERCLREIRAVAALPGHENIVAQYRAWQEGGHFYIQMDYCEGGSLHQYLYGKDVHGKGTLTERESWEVAAHVADGLHFLHNHNVLHLDIKPENLYRDITDDGTAGPWKIGDFGLAVAKESKDWEEGDGDYVAPELLRSGCDPSTAADVFSLGATLYECALGSKLPRKEGTSLADISGLESKSPELFTLVSAMTLPEPTERPLACQVAQYAKEMLRCIDQKERQGIVSPLPRRRNAMEKKWMPSLSPLHSDCGNTPGAAAGLIGLTPSPEEKEVLGEAEEAEKPQKPLRLPKLSIPPVIIPPSNTNASTLNTARTSETCNSFRIQRRDFVSPGRDLTASDSEALSYSCDTGSLSELEFAEIVSPKSGRTYNPGPLSSRLLNGACPLNLELNTSPELAISAQTSPAQNQHNLGRDEPHHSFSAPTSGRSCESVPKFPSLGDTEQREGKIAPQKLSRDASGLHFISPFEKIEQARKEGKSMKKSNKVKKAIVPHLELNAPAFGRKRQLSSRRMRTNSFKENEPPPSARSTDLSSSRSVDNMMPQKKEARYSKQERNDTFGVERRPLQGAHNACPMAAAVYMDSMTLEDWRY